MAYDQQPAAQPEEKKPDLKALHAKWVAEIENYEREAEPWTTRSKKIVKLYKDDSGGARSAKRFNVLWSNVQTLQPALYARDPKPEIERRHKDADPVGRAASEVLQRCVSYTIACHGFSDVMKQCVQDRLLPGRGVVWTRYCPSYAPLEVERKTQVTEDVEPALKLAYEQAIPDYVFYEDFGHNVARTWEEVSCVWRKVYMSREQLVKRFGTRGQTIPLDHAPKGSDKQVPEHVKKACIYEGWDKEAGAVWFLSRSFPEVIEYKADPLQLTGVFPCPRPLFATITNDSLIPTPDYALYQTQAQEIEQLTARIDSLQKALRLIGVYDSSAPALQQLLTGSDNKLVPVSTWAGFAEKGGLKGAIEWLPIKEVADVLVALYEAREKAKADLYEITGIADIIRGNSDPRETAKAQQIKGRFAVLRISDAQQDVQRFARDIIRLLAEIIAEHFSLDTIRAISGYRLLTEEEKQLAQIDPNAQQDPKLQELLAQPSWEQVHELLKDNVLREFRVEVETDSTIRTDEEAERISRTEFLTAASGFLRQAVEAGQQAPELGPFLGELLMFGIRSFKTGRTLEPVFEEGLRKLQKSAGQPKQDPEMAKMQGELQLEREKAQLKAQQETAVQEAQARQKAEELTLQDQKAERDAQRAQELARYQAGINAQLEREKQQMELDKAVQIERIKAESAERIENMRADAKREEIRLQATANLESRRIQASETAAEREHSTRFDGERAGQLVSAAGEVTKALSELKKLRGTA